MDEEIDIRDLFLRSEAGDHLATEKWLQLQRSGRAIRFYPDGRKGPSDQGQVAFGIRVEGAGADRTIIIESGMLTQVIAIPRSKAHQVARAILQVAGHGVVGNFAAQAIAVEDSVWIRMPNEETDWRLSLLEARGVAGIILAAAMDH